MNAGNFFFFGMYCRQWKIRCRSGKLIGICRIEVFSKCRHQKRFPAPLSGRSVLSLRNTARLAYHHCSTRHCSEVGDFDLDRSAVAWESAVALDVGVGQNGPWEALAAVVAAVVAAGHSVRAAAYRIVVVVPPGRASPVAVAAVVVQEPFPQWFAAAGRDSSLETCADFLCEGYPSLGASARIHYQSD